MSTRLLTGRDGIAEAAALLLRGETVAIPTETVYGLACILDDQAVDRVFEAKGRPRDNPLIVHIARPEDLADIARDIPSCAAELTQRFWPGPLTLVLPKASGIPDSVTAGLDTVAVRCPGHDTARAVIRASAPLAAPSANRSGTPSPTTAAHVMEDMNGRIAAVLDAGPCAVGLESTVLDVSCAVPRLLRPGGVTLEQLESVLGHVEVDKAVLAGLAATETPHAPGMKYKHYAPQTPLVLLSGPAEAARNYVHVRPDCGILCLQEEAAAFSGLHTAVYTPESLFAALRQLDEKGYSCVYVRLPKAEGLNLAVVNRLRKAAGYVEVVL